jgi:hypothetical protein
MSNPEVWLRGVVVADVPTLLQPVAHSLLQCGEEVAAVLPGLPPDQIWIRPGSAASVGFHARHAAGSLDRLLTYARGEQLSAAQLAALERERDVDSTPGAAARLAAEFDAIVSLALDQLRSTPAASLTAPRTVGRAGLPSTVIGLLFHAAEHTQRHVGQLVTTIKIVRGPA